MRHGDPTNPREGADNLAGKTSVGKLFVSSDSRKSPGFRLGQEMYLNV